MSRVIYNLMIVLMILWTAVLALDLIQGVLSGGMLGADAAPTATEAAGNVFRNVLSNIWGPAAQARAVVWGLPMIVFALIAAISQR